MKAEPHKLTVKSKILVEDEKGDVIIESGRVQILRAVEVHGSINSAAKALGMSYRRVWGKIKATENRMGQLLITRRTGGIRGQGSDLTPLAHSLIERFRHLDDLVRTISGTLFEGVLSDALVARRVKARREDM